LPRLTRLSPRAGWGLALGAVLLAALLLRLWGIKSGLPYVYDTDEDQHFVPHAISLLGHNGNPNYFDNPPAYTYLLAVVYEIWFGGRAALSHAFAVNPTEVWVIARVVSAVLGVLAVWLLYLFANRLFERRVALLAAALMAVAFLPVFYSKLALNDVPTLVPVELALYAAAGILRTGRRRYYALGGLALGVAAATKYTGGIVILPLAAAMLLELRERATRETALRSAALAGGLAVVAFVACDPYSLLAFGSFKAGIALQGAESAAASGKLGLTHGSGVLYYLWTATWGVGWIPAIAALFGLVALWFSERRLLFLFAPALVVYLIFMGLQGRYFGRWLMPVVPFICVLAAYAGIRGADVAARGRSRLRLGLALLAGVAICAQGLVYSIHSGLVSSRADTRNLTRAWLVAHVPLGTAVVIEPVVPEEWGLDVGHPLATANGYRWKGFPILRQNMVDGHFALATGPSVTIENYEKLLSPALISAYEANDFCWVVTGSQQSGRASVDPTAVPQAIAYYHDLSRDGRLVYQSSPYAAASRSVSFNFDWSFDYYPLAYERPGPLMQVYRLREGRCTGGQKLP
jgi:4-amino-4-deoxy-L-arabinose transferase-like glycosyltransferase